MSHAPHGHENPLHDLLPMSVSPRPAPQWFMQSMADEMSRPDLVCAGRLCRPQCLSLLQQLRRQPLLLRLELRIPLPQPVQLPLPLQRQHTQLLYSLDFSLAGAWIESDRLSTPHLLGLKGVLHDEHVQPDPAASQVPFDERYDDIRFMIYDFDFVFVP